MHDCLLFMNRFCGSTDLSQPDPWILPIIAGVATFIAFYHESGSLAGRTLPEAAAQMNGDDENDEVHLPYNDCMDGKIIPVRLSSYTGQ